MRERPKKTFKDYWEIAYTSAVVLGVIFFLCSGYLLFA
jgi:hypothetical protein